MRNIRPEYLTYAQLRRAVLDCVHVVVRKTKVMPALVDHDMTDESLELDACLADFT